MWFFIVSRTTFLQRSLGIVAVVFSSPFTSRKTFGWVETHAQKRFCSRQRGSNNPHIQLDKLPNRVTILYPWLSLCEHPRDADMACNAHDCCEETKAEDERK
jgi:hypothetical protein